MARQGVTADPDTVGTALVAREAGASLREAGKSAGVSHVSVKNYEEGKSPAALEGVTVPLLTRKRHELADKHSRAATVALDSLLDNDGEAIKKASAYQRSIMSGIHTQRFVEVLGSEGGSQGGINALAQLVSLPEGRQVLSNMAGLLAQAIRLQRELPEPAIDAEVVENVDAGESGE